MDVVVTEELIELSSSGCGNVVVGLNEPLGLRPIDGCVLGVGKVVSGSVVCAGYGGSLVVYVVVGCLNVVLGLRPVVVGVIVGKVVRVGGVV